MTTRDNIVDESVESSKDRGSRAALGVIAALLALLLITTGIMGWLIYNEYHSAAQRGTNLAAQVRSACADPKVDTSDLGSLCDRADKVVADSPVVPQKGDKGEKGDTGPTGPAPSMSQVAQAVKEYCSTGVCRGVVTDTQVRTAVRLYCAIRKSCKGPTGDTGATGATGATGDQGPAGKDGKDGTNGTDGTNGQDAFPFTFTFSIQQPVGNPTTYTCVVQDPSTTATCTENS